MEGQQGPEGQARVAWDLTPRVHPGRPRRTRAHQDSPPKPSRIIPRRPCSPGPTHLPSGT